MRTVIQRVKYAQVEVDSQVIAKIGQGLLVLLGIEDADTPEDQEWLSRKICSLRIFDDEQHIMNKSVTDIDGEILCVSQFTLMAQTAKGNRPSYIRASKGAIAEPVYNAFCEKMAQLLKKEIKKGKFGADMQVSLLNDGPVTICIDSKKRE
ncbi:MAG: D-tyrosyl-tRNA(Tyr) deacylase [Paludibacteraceae bacterium]|nr:D-tyrosyl-tRNA(Tyr) deacylase [Paludibacteraceae bacterium]